MHCLSDLLVNREKNLTLFPHLVRNIRTIEDWNHVCPELLHIFPHSEELYHRLQGFLKAVNLHAETLGVGALRD